MKIAVLYGERLVNFGEDIKPIFNYKTFYTAFTGGFYFVGRDEANCLKEGWQGNML